MASIEGSIIVAIKSALTLSGFRVFDSIIDHHTGNATKSKTYVMLSRAIDFSWDEITQDVIQGEFTLALRYYQGVSKVRNSESEMVSTASACFALEKAISQVQTRQMFNRINIARQPTEATNLRGFTADYVISGTIAGCQDRSVV